MEEYMLFTLPDLTKPITDNRIGLELIIGEYLDTVDCAVRKFKPRLRIKIFPKNNYFVDYMYYHVNRLIKHSLKMQKENTNA